MHNIQLKVTKKSEKKIKKKNQHLTREGKKKKNPLCTIAKEAFLVAETKTLAKLIACTAALR